MKRIFATTLAVGMIPVALLSGAELAWSSGHRAGPVRMVSRPDQRVVEFMAATDPTRPTVIAATAISIDGPQSSDVSCAVFVSHDSGRHWRMSRPFAGSDGADPWIAWDRSHRLHATCLQFDGQIHYAFSRDDGRHWIPGASPVRDKPVSQDKESITATHDGDLLTCNQEWTFGDGGPESALSTNQRLFVYRSTDLGRSWSGTKIIRNTQAICNGFALGPSGQVSTVVWQPKFVGAGGRVDVAVVTSDDHGKRWRRPVALGTSFVEDTPIYEYQWQPAPQMPSIAADERSGAVYVAYSRRSARWSMVVWRSMDGGRTFRRSSVPTPESTPCQSADKMNPALGVDRTGRVGIVFTCRTDLRAEVVREVWFASSSNGTRTWSRPQLLARHQAPNTNVNPAAQLPNPYMGVYRYDSGGDYWGMATTPSGFLAMWIDYRNGFPQLWAREIPRA